MIKEQGTTNFGAGKKFRLVLRDNQGTTREMGGDDMGIAVGIVDNIFMNALDTGTSDIHLQPERDQLRIRFRQDGILHETGQLPPDHAGNVTTSATVASASSRVNAPS